jgi:hypothetical protein
VEPHIVFEPADLRRAAGQDQVLRRNGVDDVGWRQPLRLERHRVEVDLDLRLLAAVGLRNGRALDRRELRAQEIHAEVVELLLR